MIIFGISQTLLLNGFIFDGVSAGIMLGLWLIKRASICRSRSFKQLQLYCYLWMTITHLIVMITNWLNLSLLLTISIPIFTTLFIMNFYLNRRGTSKLE